MGATATKLWSGAYRFGNSGKHSHQMRSCSRNYSHSTDVYVSIIAVLDRLLFAVSGIVEYAFGIHIGFAIGWLFGLWTGNIYVEECEPVYFSGLSEIRQWWLMPYKFAGCGAIIGVIVGAIVIAVVNGKLSSHKAATLHEKEATPINWGAKHSGFLPLPSQG